MRSARALVLTLTVLLLAVGAAPAVAGTYHVEVCHSPDGASAPLDGTTTAGAAPNVFDGTYGACGSGGYVYATLGGASPHGPSDSAVWTFTAPAGTSISGFSLARYMYAATAVPYGSPIATVSVISSSGAATVLSQCSQTYACTTLGVDPANPFDPSNMVSASGLGGVSAIRGSAFCGGGGTCPAGGTAQCPELVGSPCIVTNRLYALDAVLVDSTPPTASGVGGSLVNGASISGSANVEFQAADTGSGLYLASVVIDGEQVASQLVGSNDLHCSPVGTASGGSLEFNWTVPCQLAASPDVTINTTSFADGPHNAQVLVRDAAGNTTVVWSGVVHTLNAPQGGVPAINGVARQGQMLAAVAGTWTPTPLRIAYQWERCDAGGHGCAPIPGATAPSYTLTSEDAYHEVTVLVSASDADGSLSALAPATAVVADARGRTSAPAPPRLSVGSTPAVGGAPRTGGLLTVSPGAWTNGPVSFSYQWERCGERTRAACAAIAGARGASYTPQAADLGHRLKVIIRVQGPGGAASASARTPRIARHAAASSGSSTGVVGTGLPAGVANGAGACRAAHLVVALDGHQRLVVALGQQASLTGRVTCRGRGIAAARIELAIVLRGGRSTATTQLISGPDGSFRYRVPAGATRSLTATYWAFGGDRRPAARATAVLGVTATLTLTITPARTTNGHTIHFVGRVLGGHIPFGGLPIQIEYLEGSRWMVYDQTVARRRDGRFSYSYTFRRTTQPITYQFRVALPTTGVPGYPYQPAASAPRSVLVDP